MKMLRRLFPIAVIVVACANDAPPAPRTADPVVLAHMTRASALATDTTPPALVGVDSVFLGGSLLLTSAGVKPQRWTTATPGVIAVTASADGTQATVRGLAVGEGYVLIVRDTLKQAGKSANWKLRTDSTLFPVRVVPWCDAFRDPVAVVLDRAALTFRVPLEAPATDTTVGESTPLPPPDSTAQASAELTDLCGRLWRTRVDLDGFTRVYLATP